MRWTHRTALTCVAKIQKIWSLRCGPSFFDVGLLTGDVACLLWVSWEVPLLPAAGCCLGAPVGEGRFHAVKEGIVSLAARSFAPRWSWNRAAEKRTAGAIIAIPWNCRVQMTGCIYLSASKHLQLISCCCCCCCCCSVGPSGRVCWNCLRGLLIHGWSGVWTDAKLNAYIYIDITVITVSLHHYCD